MSETHLRRLAWILAIYTVVASGITAVQLFTVADYSRLNWLEAQVRGIVNIGAPLVGLVIIRQQPRHRIGWLWLLIGVLVSFRTVGHAVYYVGGAQPTGHSSLAQFLMWFTEPTNLGVLICQALLLLWFPTGQLLSRRWRYLYFSLFLGVSILFLSTFMAGTNWNGGEVAGGIVINNPYGWLTLDNLPFDHFLNFIGFPAFLTIIISTILAAISLVVRYRSAHRLVRYQIRWFVLGGMIFVILNFVPALTVRDIEITSRGSRWILTIAFSNSLPLYLAVGLAILRYRLYDIDLIIRKTVQYGMVTAVLALVYFGTIILLQSLVGQATGEQSPIIIVLSTLLIAAMFNPLRQRVQTAVDRRFYRQKYDAQQVLADFAETARDEVEMEALQAELLRVVQETMQPNQISVWLKEDSG